MWNVGLYGNLCIPDNENGSGIEGDTRVCKRSRISSSFESAHVLHGKFTNTPAQSQLNCGFSSPSNVGENDVTLSMNKKFIYNKMQ